MKVEQMKVEQMKAGLCSLCVEETQCETESVSLGAVTGDLPFGGGATSFDVRFQDQRTVVAFHALVHPMVWHGMGTGLVRALVATHTLSHTFERRLVVAVRAHQV